jgi:TonB family protein
MKLKHIGAACLFWVSGNAALADPPKIVLPEPLPGNVCSTENYPSEALAACAQGRAVIAFRLETDGSVHRPTVLVSTGNTALDRASQSCVANLKYTPATINGTPVWFPWEDIIIWKLPAGSNCPAKNENASPTHGQ